MCENREKQILVAPVVPYNAAAAAFWGSWLFGSGVGRTMFVRPCHYEVKPIMWFCWPGEDDERK